MNERVEIFSFDAATFQDAYQVRREVFVVEQKIPEELELDEADATATHLAAFIDGRVVGTLRVLRYGDAAKIGRLAVLSEFRHRGIATHLMDQAVDHARDRGFAQVLLDSQVPVQGFYDRLGFRAEGDEFDDAGIPHIRMRRHLRP